MNPVAHGEARSGRCAALAEDLSRRLSTDSMIRCDEPLSRRTTLRVGGPADLYVEPASEADLAAVLQFCREHNQPYFLLGRGSNLLVRDQGIRGLVICLAHPHFSQVLVEGDHVTAGAGAKLKAVAVEAKRHALGGLEFLEGIPGSVGGALRMNAGAMGSAIFDLVEQVRWMKADGSIAESAAHEMDAVYRNCRNLKSGIALSVRLCGRPEPREAIEQRMNEFSRKRWQSQPAAPSAGCMFKNPAAIPAGKLIDELGLKGTRVGGAMVSMEHGNFLVNDGSATAHDVLELMELVRRRARGDRGIELEPEVEIVGE